MNAGMGTMDAKDNSTIPTSPSESRAATGLSSVGLTCRFRPFSVVDFRFVFGVEARALAERPGAGGRLAFAT